MGKVGNGVNGSEEEQGIGTSDENGEQNVERRFCCFGCKDNFIVTRFTGFRCVFVLLLSVAVLLPALFWLPPFLKFADQGGLDLDYRSGFLRYRPTFWDMDFLIMDCLRLKFRWMGYVDRLNKVLESADVLCSIDDRSLYRSHEWLVLLGAASKVLLSFVMTIEFDHDIVASFLVNKSASLLEDNILKLQDDIFDEMNVPNTKVVVLSLEPFAGSNITKVMFGVDPLQNDSKISSTDQSLIRGLFGSLVVNDSSLRLTKSLFGDAFSFEVLKFPGGITIIPPQSVFLLQKVRIPFNFTLNFSIFQTRENFAELKSQLMTGLHLTTREQLVNIPTFECVYENVAWYVFVLVVRDHDLALGPSKNLYINLWNSQGSTVAPPTTVLSSVILVIGNTPRLKQLAQTIRGHSKNLGLNNTVFGKVKQVRLSSILQHSLHGGNGRKGSHLAPSNAPSSSHFSATSPQPDNGPPSVSPTPSQISQTIPVSSPLPNVVFAHAQPPSGGKPKEHSDTMLPVSPSPAPSSCLHTVQWSIVLSLAALTDRTNWRSSSGSNAKSKSQRWQAFDCTAAAAVYSLLQKCTPAYSLSVLPLNF
ncbi:hypothetical protein DKX38_008955 [Salix brachista]|uniref:DUF7036 domain-containing protein n=1 Tax=Salix brachista TaxID=2182728 RepID=A0A5N5M995_9ROSI|nr:hypothetical protein DKX38_008955 [Salix brachista]